MTYCAPVTYHYSSCKCTDWSAASISGRLSFDVDRDNGERGVNGLDAGVGGKAVYLLDSYGRVVASTTTADDGSYKFGQLKAGNYKVSFEGQSGHSFASKDVGDGRFDSDANANGMTDYICVSKCQNITDIDASLQRDVGKISGSVFFDTNCDGINGTAKVVPGPCYTIEAEAMCKSWGLTTFSAAQASGGKAVKLQCGTTGTLSDNFDGKTGTYDVVIRVQDENDGRSTIQLKVDGKLVTAIRLDRDGDGGGDDNGGFSDFVISGVKINCGSNIQLAVCGNGGEFVRIDNITFKGAPVTVLSPEPPKANVQIVLLDANDNVVATTYTDANGTYQFKNVPTGQYKVMGVAPDGTHFTLKDIGGNDAIDSDVGGNGQSDLITVVKGGCYDIDLGVCEIETGALSGRYFLDENNNGVDDNEAGIAGKTVVLLAADGTTVIATTTTGANGAYGFADVEAGNYIVRFEDSSAETRHFVGTDVGGDDTVDSDVDASGVTGTVTVVAGAETKDVDAGVADDDGSLSGRYFFDADRSATDNGDEGVADKTVTLYAADGVTVVATTTTDTNGNYSFTGLRPGSYVVAFEDSLAEGRPFVAADQGGDDAVDSDVTSGGITGSVVVVAGAETTDVDAGVYVPNKAPVAEDDAGKTCADETTTVALLANDSDPEDDMLFVTSIQDEDETVGVGGTITLASGALVTLNADGTVTYDGIAAHADLLIGTQTVDTFSYTLSDGDLTADADVAITVCGDLNTPETIDEALFQNATVQFTLGAFPGTSPIDGYEATLSNLVGLGSYTIADLGGPTVNAIYCLDESQAAFTRVLTTANIHVATEANALAVGVNATGAANMDLVNWLLNQTIVGTDNNDGNGTTYTDLEMQEAIWTLMNGDQFIIGNYSWAPDDNNGVLDGDEVGTIENVLEIVAMAMADGEGFVAGAGDILGLILDPTAPARQQQPFIIGVDFDTFAQDCLCS